MAYNTDIVLFMLLVLVIIVYGADLHNLKSRVKRLEKADENWRPKFGPKPPL